MYQRYYLFIIASLLASYVLADDTHFNKAKTLYGKKEYRTAVIELKNHLQQSPRDAKARVLLGWSYFKQNQLAQAEKEFLQARDYGAAKTEWVLPLGKIWLLLGQHDRITQDIVVDSKDSPAAKADILSVYGLLELSRNGIDKARGRFLEAQSLVPEQAEANLGLARIISIEGDLDKALALIEQLLVREPLNIDAKILKSSLLTQRGKLAEAEVLLKQIVKDEPGHIFARIGRASLLIDMQKIDDAFIELESLRKILPKSPVIHYLRAKAFLIKNNFDASFDALQEVISVNPDHLPSQLLLGYVYYQRNQLRQAETALRKYLEKEPTHIPANKLLTAIYLRLNQASDAIALLSPLVKQAPHDVQLLALLAEAYTATKQYDKAITLLNQAVQLNPNASQLHTQLGILQLRSGATEIAISQLEQAVSLNSNIVQADTLLLMTYLQNQQYDKAIILAKKTIQKNPNNPLGYNLLGSAYAAQQKFEDAKTQFEKSLKLDPNFVAAHVNLGRIALSTRAWNEAVTHLEAAIKQDKDHATAYISLAQAYYELNQTQQATALLKDFFDSHQQPLNIGLPLLSYYTKQQDFLSAQALVQQLLKAYPKETASWQAAGALAMTMNNYPRAVQYFEQLTRLQPNQAQFYAMLANAKFANKDLDGALQNHQQALNADPKFLPSLIGKAEIQASRGLFAEALATIEQALRLYSNNAGPWQVKGMINARQGHYQDAIASYQKALALAPKSVLVLLLSEAYVQSKQHEQAIKLMQNWLAKNANDRTVRFYLANQYQTQHRFDEAQQQYELLLQQDPNHMPSLNNLAWLLWERRDPKSLEYVERLIKLQPRQSSMLDTIGWILAENNQFGRARPYLEEAYIQLKKNSEVSYHLAFVYHQLGLLEQAKELLKALLKDKTASAFHPKANALLESMEKRK